MFFYDYALKHGIKVSPTDSYSTISEEFDSVDDPKVKDFLVNIYGNAVQYHLEDGAENEEVMDRLEAEFERMNQELTIRYRTPYGAENTIKHYFGAGVAYSRYVNEVGAVSFVLWDL